MKNLKCANNVDIISCFTSTISNTATVVEEKRQGALLADNKILLVAV